jgi:hypothetical protein
MKIRLTITDRRWAHKLQAKRDEQGRYFVQLINQGGQPFAHGMIIGAFESLDAVVMHAPRLYAELLARLPAEAAPLPTIVPSRN